MHLLCNQVSPLVTAKAESGCIKRAFHQNIITKEPQSAAPTRSQRSLDEYVSGRQNLGHKLENKFVSPIAVFEGFVWLYYNQRAWNNITDRFEGRQTWCYFSKQCDVSQGLEGGDLFSKFLQRHRQSSVLYLFWSKLSCKVSVNAYSYIAPTCVWIAVVVFLVSLIKLHSCFFSCPRGRGLVQGWELVC